MVRTPRNEYAINGTWTRTRSTVLHDPVLGSINLATGLVGALTGVARRKRYLMLSATPPIVIDGDGCFDVYATVAEACSWLEAVDVDDGLYEAFDSEGHPLRLVTDGNIVSIELPTDSIVDSAELEHRIRNYISWVNSIRVRIPIGDDSSISTMLQALLRFQLEKGGKSRK